MRPAELLTAALDAFRAKGFAATRMEDVAAQAGVSKGTVYLYYPSKQAIFEALVRENVLPNIERIEIVLAAASGTASDRLRLVLAAAGQAMSDPRVAAIPKLILGEAGNFPDLARFYREQVIARGLGMIGGIIEQGSRSGEFRQVDPHLAARLFFAPLLLAVLWQTTFAPIEDAPVPPHEFLGLHIEFFLRAVAADPTRERPA